MAWIPELFKGKKKLLLEGITDWHCHLLPSVDDGVQTMEEALSILSAYEDAGISSIWLTPHVMEDFPNTTELLKRSFTELRNAYFGPVELHLAAEYMIDNLFMERLETNDLLPIGDDARTLLVETSYFSAPLNFYSKLKTIKSKGYYPLLAHPERYN